MAILLDGKKLSERILGNLKKRIKKSGKKLKLTAILVGEDKNSLIFLRQKEKACQFVGIDFQLYRFPANICENELAKEIKKIAADKLCHGIIIQLPLPGHINTDRILSLIPAQKDVDVLSGKTIKPEVLSPVLAGILALLKEYKINLRGKKIAVVGRGRLVGQPIIKWLEARGIKPIDDIRKADIIISGVGKPGFIIKGDMVKRGAIVIDAAGDVDFESVAKKASFITPTPGGVGPMTVAMVIKDLLILNGISIDQRKGAG